MLVQPIPRGTDFAVVAVVMNQPRVIAEPVQQRARGDSPFLPRRVLREAGAVGALDQVVQHQRDDHQEHRGSDASRRVQEHRPHGQRSLEHAVDLFALALLCEPREELVRAALLQRDRGHDRVEAVVLFVALEQRGVERELRSGVVRAKNQNSPTTSLPARVPSARQT